MHLILGKSWTAKSAVGGANMLATAKEFAHERSVVDFHIKVLWFDAKLNERPQPDAPGRWAALIEGAAPNGTRFRRSMTFFCRPPGFLFVWPPEVEHELSPQPGPIAAEIWKVHEEEVLQPLKQSILKDLNDRRDSDGRAV
jgi:hypothetical protein